MQVVSNPPGHHAYVIGPYAGPVATVTPGETFAEETVKAFENRISSPDDGADELCSQVVRVRLANMVDILYTVVAKLTKVYLPAR